MTRGRTRAYASIEPAFEEFKKQAEALLASHGFSPGKEIQGLDGRLYRYSHYELSLAQGTMSLSGLRLYGHRFINDGWSLSAFFIAKMEELI